MSLEIEKDCISNCSKHEMYTFTWTETDEFVTQVCFDNIQKFSCSSWLQVYGFGLKLKLQLS